MLIQFHMLQNYAPSNLNRDDMGSPKSAFFGGTQRARISSQSLKRSIRTSEQFKASFKAKGLLANRTKTLPNLLKEALEAMEVEGEELKQIVTKAAEIGRESKKPTVDTEAENDDTDNNDTETDADESETKQLIFIGADEVPPLAEKLLAQYRASDAKKWAKIKIAEITGKLGTSVPRSVDVAMFGRMTTSALFEDVQASVQVAHAISTHALTTEFDYYTAIDDLTNQTGAGMIGELEFNSSTYYKYFNIHWEQLIRNLGGDSDMALASVVALLEAASYAHPSGKQNSTATFALPDLVLVEISTRNIPVSYANAFQRAIRPRTGESYSSASQEALKVYMERAIKGYGLQANRAAFTFDPIVLPETKTVPSLQELGEWVAVELSRG